MKRKKKNLHLNITKGCEILAAKISRLQQKFNSLQKKQEDQLARMRQEKKELKKEIEKEQLSFIVRTIKQTGFPIDNPAILIGAILSAKEKLHSPDNANTINHFIELYTDFAEKHHVEEVGEEIVSDQGKEVNINGSEQ